MKNMRIFLMLLVCLALPGFHPAAAEDTATPQEVYQKVIQASEVLEALGEDALPEFNNPEGEFVWKDSYVFVTECSKWTVAAHPFAPQLIGQDLENLQDKEGNYFFQNFCRVAKDPNGGWTAYWWPKPGHPEDELFRKISFTIQVPNRPYQVTAGIYNDEVTVEELNTTLK